MSETSLRRRRFIDFRRRGANLFERSRRVRTKSRRSDQDAVAVGRSPLRPRARRLFGSNIARKRFGARAFPCFGRERLRCTQCCGQYFGRCSCALWPKSADRRERVARPHVRADPGEGGVFGGPESRVFRRRLRVRAGREQRRQRRCQTWFHPRILRSQKGARPRSGLTSCEFAPGGGALALAPWHFFQHRTRCSQPAQSVITRTEERRLRTRSRVTTRTANNATTKILWQGTIDGEEIHFTRSVEGAPGPGCSHREASAIELST